jgi:prevent-host-death family protein
LKSLIARKFICACPDWKILGIDLVYNLVDHGIMREVGIHEAKTHLSQLLRRVAAGEEIVIAKGGKPIARLVPIEGPKRRELGRDRGLFEVPADFDAPLPEAILADFER